MSLFFWLSQHGRLDEASPHLAPAEEAARVAGDPMLQALVLYHRGIDAYTRGDVGRALETYRQVQSTVFPDGIPYLQSFVRIRRFLLDAGAIPRVHGSVPSRGRHRPKDQGLLGGGQ
jgi:hypothetical protein